MLSEKLLSKSVLLQNIWIAYSLKAILHFTYAKITYKLSKIAKVFLGNHRSFLKMLSRCF